MKLLSHEHANLVEQAIQAAQTAGDLPAFEIPPIEVQPAKHESQGDYAVPIAKRLQNPTGLKAQDIAERIVKHLPQADFVESVEAVTGFINFRLNKNWLKQQIDPMIAEGENLFQLDFAAGKRAQVEFVSANPTGPINFGRSRGGVIGDTMARVLEAFGYTVEREYYFNNAGRQMRNVGNSLKLRYLEALGHTVEIPDDKDDNFYRGDYLIDFAKDLVAEKGDSLVDADWQPFKEYAETRMFQWIKSSLARIQINHDVFFNENSLYESGAVWKILEALEQRGYVYKSAAPENATAEDLEEAGGKGEAVWLRSTQLGDDKDRVLVKSSGEPTYTLPDIAYHVNKFERGFDLMINVLGADHGTQYKIVQWGLKVLGYDPSKLHVIINQLVRVMRDGKEFKGSTRKGIYDTLDDLVNWTSADVVRYMLLALSPTSHLTFDLDLALKQSNENPVYYIQNAHVRCAGIAREAQARGVSDEGADITLLGEDELRFIRKALELGEVIEITARTYEPHRIATYARELAAVFHPVYDNVRALHGEVPEDLMKARLRFYRAAQVAFKRVLTLMGMTAPETM